ncbi:hypothetical protein AB0M23_02875 [Streptomyces sp. NPDC052077]|jgi:hypothetical protein|uniref:hypothetical protein n=1 Tax=Streptomyces sp. NPDC052077 TaxID=3154757 RepID=UPI0034490527
MTSLPTPRLNERWLLKVTIWSARADDTRWNEQRAALRTVSSYDSVTQTWSTQIGALDLTTLAKLQTLLDAARTFGTDIRLEPAPVPTWWTGSSFTSDADVAALLATKADEGRPLGQLPMA